ncbi:MAG TPA: protein kinase [Acidimicrobiia bacterium]|nr:protein kinase [Acidimicrobiia bacterium]
MPEPPQPGRVLDGRYRLVSEVARGGMATVWDAEDTLLARRVAVKILHAELAYDEALRARFRNEAVAAARLADPGIVATYDTGDDHGVGYIVMEFVDGPTLRRILDLQGRLAVVEAVRIGREVASALSAAHREGIVHRDVKPANVLVPPEGPVKVTDFGIAKAGGGGELTRTGTVVGTARYLAPEQLRGEPVDPRTDLYALGLVLYEMLAGELPFHGDTEMSVALARLSNAPAPIRQLRPEVPAGLARLVMSCLALEPADRPPTARAVAEFLSDRPRDASQERPRAEAMHTVVMPPPEPAPVRSRPAPPPRRRRGPIALLAVILFVAGAAAGYLLVRAADAGAATSPPPATAPR